MYANALNPGHYREIGPEQMKASRIEPVQPPPIGMALEQLEKELHCLRELMRMLDQRLSPVMRPIPENGGTTGQGFASGSPLAGQIEIMTRLAAQSSADVRGMLDCLEL
jgi:hypothetical protein